MANALNDLQPWSAERLSGRQCVPGGDDPIKLAPHEEDWSFEVPETVDEDGSLSLASEDGSGNGLHCRVRTGRQAGRVHLVDTALEDETTVLEEQLEQQTRFFSRWLRFNTIEQV